MMDRHESRGPRPNDMVVLREMPAGLLDDLPTEDQRAIAEIIGKPVRLNNYDGDGRAELVFTDRDGIIHFIFVKPDMLSPAYTIQAIKDWRENEYKAGRPSELADFYHAHSIDICVDCGGQGTRVIGVRWRDDEGMERSEVGPVATLVQIHTLDDRKCWLTDVRKWDYLYAPCRSCQGSGKLSKSSKSDHVVE